MNRDKLENVIMSNAKYISDFLFENDPMNTCCKENDAFDEYDFIASEIAECQNIGEVKELFLEFFGAVPSDTILGLVFALRASTFLKS